MRFRVRLVVDEDAAADQAAVLVPVVQGRDVAISVEGGAVRLEQVILARLDAIIAHPRGLVREMYQTIPLAGALGVESDFVIEPVQLIRSLAEGDEAVFEAFAREAGLADSVDGPVEGDRVAVAGFLEGFLHDGGREDVEAA